MLRVFRQLSDNAMALVRALAVLLLGLAALACLCAAEALGADVLDADPKDTRWVSVSDDRLTAVKELIRVPSSCPPGTRRDGQGRCRYVY